MSTGGGANAPLPPEKLDQLRQAVKEQLRTLGVNDQIKSLVADKRLHPNPVKGKEAGITQQQALEKLKGQGVIDQLVKSLSQSDIVDGGTSRRQPLLAVPSLSKRYLQVKIKSGSSFAVGSSAAVSSNDYLLISGELFGQRFRSAPVIASSAPLFDASALIELPGSAMADPSTLLSQRQPLHLVVLHSQPAAALISHTTATNTARMSTSPSASISIAQQHNSWGHSPGASPPGVGSAMTHGQSSSCSTAGSSPGTALRSTSHPNPAYFLTATSGQHSHQQGSGQPAAAAMQSADLLRMSSKTGVVGSCYIDWRLALTHKGDTNCHNVQLTCGTQTDSAGMVSVELEVTPGLAKPLEPAALRAQTDAEARRDTGAQAGFSGRVKDWWQDFSRDALSQQQEGMRLTAKGEDGVLRPCCAFVKSLQLGRCLATPREAARFVSLLAPKESQRTAAESWCSLHSLLECCQATQTEKALLLASLLLGYGLDAWVCFGADAVGQQTWVLTRSTKDTALFWDPSTGIRYNPSTAGQSKGCPFRSIACVFNQRRLYGNLQAAEGLAAATYVLEDSGRWRELPVSAQDIPGATGMRFDLHMQPFDSAAHEARLESELKKLLSEHRAESLGHSPTTWDDSMAYLLMPSLAAHEQETLTGQSAAHNEDFQQCIRRSIPPGCMFKGFPQHHRSLCSSVMMQSMLKETAIRDMLSTQVADMNFAIRVKVFIYPEHVCSVWLMLALKYPTSKPTRASQ